MTFDRNRPHEPTPDQLAAYYDGELTGSARDEVDTWLADHADVGVRAAAFADHDDDLARSWQLTQPAEPAPDAWAGLLRRIEAGIAPPIVVPARRRPLGWVVGVAAAAAAVVAVVLGRTVWPTKPQPADGKPDPVIGQSEPKRLNTGSEESDTEELRNAKEPYAVLAPTQVRIISMEGDDTQVEIDGQLVRTLVVGEPPVPDAVMMPTNAERMGKIKMAGPVPHFKDRGVPMFIDPVVLDKDWQP